MLSPWPGRARQQLPCSSTAPGGKDVLGGEGLTLAANTCILQNQSLLLQRPPMSPAGFCGNGGMTRQSLPGERAEISREDVIPDKSPRCGAGRCWSGSPAHQQGGWSSLHHRAGSKGSEPSWQPLEARSRAGTRQRSAPTTTATGGSWETSLLRVQQPAWLRHGHSQGPPPPRSSAGRASPAKPGGFSLLQCDPRDGQHDWKGARGWATSPNTRPCPQHPANSHGNLGTYCSRRTRSPRGPPPPRALGS